MREAIRKRLANRITAVAERVYEPFMAGPKVTKPYLVVKMGGEKPENINSGLATPVEVWVYVERLSFTALDSLCTQIINVLNNKEVFGEDGLAYPLKYTGCSEDYFDEGWKALTRRLDFDSAKVRGG